MTPGEIGQYPVLTFASGPTNSMRGAAYLSGLKDALVVDIGGGSTEFIIGRRFDPERLESLYMGCVSYLLR